MKQLELIGLESIGEVRVGDSVGQLICDACAAEKIDLADNDVLVIAQKIVSKSEGRRIGLDSVQPSARARELGRELDKEPELVEGPGSDRIDLMAALAVLPLRQRQAVVLHYLADASVAEIAQLTGAAEGTVKSWLHRARGTLAQRLGDRDALGEGVRDV